MSQSVLRKSVHGTIARQCEIERTHFLMVGLGSKYPIQPLSSALHKFESPLPVVRLKRQRHDDVDDDDLTEKDELTSGDFSAANFPVIHTVAVSSS